MKPIDSELVTRAVALVAGGATMTAIATELQVSTDTLRSWARIGREGDARFVAFAQAVDGAKARATTARKATSERTAKGLTYRPQDVREALYRAALAVNAVLEPGDGHRAQPGQGALRFAHGERWGELRRLLHTLDADTRAAAICELLCEAVHRDAQESELAWEPRPSTGHRAPRGPSA